MIKTYYELGKQWGRRNSSQSFIEKLKISILSILVGVLLGFVILWALGYNPVVVFGKLFTSAFQDADTRNITLTFTAVYTLSGLANAFAFKTGLFNIGVSGQMLAGGAVSILLGVTVFNGMAPGAAIPLLLIIAVATAALVGLLAGILKAYLNVHEVVSTILLNWIIFYLIKYIFNPSRTFVDGAGNSSYLNRAHWFGGAGPDAWVSLLVFALVIVFLAFFILKFTTFGKKLSMTGLNKDASKYSGVNVKAITITSLVISAGIAGALGFIFYGGYKHFVPRLESTLPTWGFDGIAIALLAFSLPLAVPIISFIYAIFKSGASGSGIDMGIANETVSLIFSIIIFTAAASSVFLRFRPIAFIKYVINTIKSKEFNAEKAKMLKELAQAKKSSLNDLPHEIETIKAAYKVSITKIVRGLISGKGNSNIANYDSNPESIISKYYDVKIKSASKSKIVELKLAKKQSLSLIKVEKQNMNKLIKSAKEAKRNDIKNIKSSYKFTSHKIIEKEVVKKIDLEYKSSGLYVSQTITRFYNDKINETIFATQAKIVSMNHSKEIKNEILNLKKIFKNKIKNISAEKTPTGNMEIEKLKKLYEKELKVYEKSLKDGLNEINRVKKESRNKINSLKVSKKEAHSKSRSAYKNETKNVKDKEKLILIGKKVLKEEVTNAYI